MTEPWKDVQQMTDVPQTTLGTHELYGTIDHEHLCTEGPHHGEPAWLMLVECQDGRWFLEAEFGEWAGAEGVSKPGSGGSVPKFFADRASVVRHAAGLITQQFGTDLDAWLKRDEGDA